jgi:ABC-2 type transport system ATP-binding protein
MIRVDSLSKLYEANLAVEDLSFSVAPGDILGLVGPNGAGKTTTLRAMAGVLPPTSGTIEIGGADVVHKPIEAKRQLALIPDTPNLFESLTVHEHLEFTAQLYGVREWQPKAERLLEEMELTPQKEKLADELSHGMRQKVAVCCAFLHDPVALLLDEPLTGLDPRGIRTLFKGLEQRAAQGAAIVLSTHLLGQIEGFCNRFLILRRGRRLFYGSKDEIRRELPSLKDNASLEEIFFEATESGSPK